MKRLLAFGAIALALALAMVPAKAQDQSFPGNLRMNCSTATASAGAATLANKCGVLTSEALTTAAGSPYTLTLTNTVATAGDIVLFSVSNGSNTIAIAAGTAIASANQIVFIVRNVNNAAQPLNGTVLVNYLLLKP